jgi:hypothetical protein
MLCHSNHATDTLYFETLDIPLPELEQLKTLKVRGVLGRQQGEWGVPGVLWQRAAASPRLPPPPMPRPTPQPQGMHPHTPHPPPHPPRQINFHDERTSPVGEPLTVRVAQSAAVSDVLEEVRKRLPEEHAAKRLRLLEVLGSKIYKVCDPGEDIGSVNESYWTLRAEPVPDDDGDAAAPAAAAAAGGGGGDGGGGGGGDLLVHVYHVAPDKQEVQQQQLSGAGGGGGRGTRSKAKAAAAAAAEAKGGDAKGAPDAKQQQTQQQDGDAAPGPVPVLPFGEPFLLRIGRSEPLSSVKARIRTRLDVKPDAFAKWRFCFVPTGRALPEYLSDADVPAERFLAPGAAHALGAEVAFLGCEHEDRGSKRPSGHRAAYGFERPVKINS